MAIWVAPGNDEEMPGAGINMVAVYVRNEHARQMVAGFAATISSLGDFWQQVDRALADVPALGSVVARLTAELAGARLDRANLVSAIRAALAAQARGDDDPLSYLREVLAGWRAIGELPGGDGDDA